MADKYIAYFDTAGFEYVANITAMEADYIMTTLKGETYSLPFSLEALRMRARFNPQRSPEIWFFNVDSDMDEQSVKQLAEENPQYLADFIRKNGKCLHSSGPKVRPVIQ